MENFLYSRSYTFHTISGKKTYAFSLVRRSKKIAVFKLRNGSNKEEFPATIFTANGMEVAAFIFNYNGIQIFLEANTYLPKGYDFSLEGQKQMILDRKQDTDILAGIYKS